MKQLHWRGLLVANAAPAVIFWLLSIAFLKDSWGVKRSSDRPEESPVFSATAGNKEEAHNTLHEMMRGSACPFEPRDAKG